MKTNLLNKNSKLKFSSDQTSVALTNQQHKNANLISSIQPCYKKLLVTSLEHLLHFSPENLKALHAIIEKSKFDSSSYLYSDDLVSRVSFISFYSMLGQELQKMNNIHAFTFFDMLCAPLSSKNNYSCKIKDLHLLFNVSPTNLFLQALPNQDFIQQILNYIETIEQNLLEGEKINFDLKSSDFRKAYFCFNEEQFKRNNYKLLNEDEKKFDILAAESRKQYNDFFSFPLQYYLFTAIFLKALLLSAGSQNLPEKYKININSTLTKVYGSNTFKRKY